MQSCIWKSASFFKFKVTFWESLSDLVEAQVTSNCVGYQKVTWKKQEERIDVALSETMRIVDPRPGGQISHPDRHTAKPLGRPDPLWAPLSHPKVIDTMAKTPLALRGAEPQKAMIT